MGLRTDNLLIPQGTTWEVRWPVVNADGTPAVLDDWTVRAQARDTRASTEVLHEWSTILGNASIIDNSVSLRFGPAESSAWEFSTAVFDVEIVSPTDQVMRVTQGQIAVDREVTR